MKSEGEKEGTPSFHKGSLDRGRGRLNGVTE